MNITKEVHSYTLHPSSVHSTRVHTSCIFAPNTCHQAKNPQHWGIMSSASRNLGTTPLQKDLFMLCDPFPYFVFIILIMNPTAYMFYKFDSVSLFMKFLCTVIPPFNYQIFERSVLFILFKSSLSCYMQLPIKKKV